MDIIDLPWLEPGTNVGDAVDRLIRFNRFGAVRAVATRIGDKPVIIEAEQIIDAARLDSRTELAALPALGNSVSFEPFEAPGITEFEQVLDDQHASYGLIPLGSIARVVTRHESLAGALRVHLSICQCDDGHVSSPDELLDPATCWCGMPVHCS